MEKSSKRTLRSSSSQKEPTIDHHPDTSMSVNRRDNPLAHKLSIVVNTNPSM